MDDVLTSLYQRAAMTERDDDIARSRVPPHSVEAEQSILGGLLLPLAAFVEMAMVQFGLDRETAERMIKRMAEAQGVPVESVGHA